MSAIGEKVVESPDDGLGVDDHVSYYQATKLYWFFIERMSSYGLCFDVSVKEIVKVIRLAGEYVTTIEDFKAKIVEPLVLEISNNTELSVKCSLSSVGGVEKIHFEIEDTSWKTTLSHSE